MDKLQSSSAVLIWDLPLRMFHWMQALAFAGAFWTADSERYRDIHVMLGYTLLGLLAFRLVWGFCGTRHSRFSSFLYKPGEVARYFKSIFRRNPPRYAGHNPAGSLMIWLLLASGAISCVTGVLALQDIGGDALVDAHAQISDAMLVMVAMHISGVVAGSLWHRESLVRAMVSGYKRAASEESAERAYIWLGALLPLAALAFCGWYYASAA